MADCIDEQEAKEYQDHERLGAGQQQRRPLRTGQQMLGGIPSILRLGIRK